MFFRYPGTMSSAALLDADVGAEAIVRRLFSGSSDSGSRVGASASTVASACHAVAAIAMASADDVATAHWSGLAAAASARLAPTDPARIMFVRQMLESAGANTLNDSDARACVAGTVGSLAAGPSRAAEQGWTDPRRSTEVAIVAAAANKITVEGICRAHPSPPWRRRTEKALAAAVVGPVRMYGLPELDWEASEIAGAVAGLAPKSPLEAADLLHIAAAELFSEKAVGSPRRDAPARALLRAVAKAAPVFADSLTTLTCLEAGRTARLIVESALSMYLADPDSTQTHACFLSMTIQKSEAPGARDFTGSGADLSKLLALVTRRLPEALDRGDVASASCAMYMLRYHVLSAWRLRRHCSAAPLYGTCIEKALRLAREGLTRADETSASPKTKPKPMSTPAGLAFIAASSALLLARASPSFTLSSPGVGTQLWALAEASTDLKTTTIAALSLFYFHALRGPDGGGGAREFLTHICGQATLKQALPFCRAATRLAMYWKDGPLADRVCAAMKTLLDRGPASPEDAGRAVRLLESGLQSGEVAAELVKSAISRAADCSALPE